MTLLIICLLLAIFFPYLMKGVIVNAIKKETQYDNHYQRIQQSQLTGLGARAVGAQQNGFESLAVFATAVLTAMITLHVGGLVQGLAVLYILSRIAYNYCYLKDLASMRSMMWMISFVCCLAILISCLF